MTTTLLDHKLTTYGLADMNRMRELLLVAAYAANAVVLRPYAKKA